MENKIIRSFAAAMLTVLAMATVAAAEDAATEGRPQAAGTVTVDTIVEALKNRKTRSMAPRSGGQVGGD